MAHLTIEQLRQRVKSLPDAPTDHGRLLQLVVRPETGSRKVVETCQVVPGLGVIGDNYTERGSSSTPDGAANPEAQICVMNAAVLNVIADDDRDRWQLAGDQLLVDFDLSTTNLPTGARFSIGTAVFEVSAKPHTGCQKFSKRFGLDARRFVDSDPVERYRGINVMVISEGRLAVGDPITKHS